MRLCCISGIETVQESSNNFGEPLRLGGYNILYRVHVEGLQQDTLVRVPCPNLSQFPAEKTLLEVVPARLLGQATQLPVLSVLHYEIESEIGPYIMLPFITNKGDMTDVLAKRRQNTDEVPALDEDTDETLLRDMYSKLAWCLVQFWQPEVSRIGYLRESDGYFSVLGRPITQSMGNMIQLANILLDVLPLKGKTYEWAFDAVDWKYLDERFFGERYQASTGDKLWDMLSDREKIAMELFVKKKMRESDVRKLVHWTPEEARSRLTESFG